MRQAYYSHITYMYIYICIYICMYIYIGKRLLPVLVYILFRSGGVFLFLRSCDFSVVRNSLCVLLRLAASDESAGGIFRVNLFDLFIGDFVYSV